ncbi:hypothetical protein PENSPDRAFT_645596 [Peniophora sp. CONT]|nr:hypothetical protein PENSPDRAFT_645596 [Peniophora sp. CONT]
MGKLNIAHHKSYHPYRADNIARVRQDEARAKAEAKQDNDRALAADAEARIDALRKRAGIDSAAGAGAGTSTSVPVAGPSTSTAIAGPSSTSAPASTPAAPSAPPGDSGHINLFADLEAHESSLAARASTKKPALTNDDRGFALAPSKEDLSPWYSSSKDAVEDGKSGGKGKRAGWAAREQRRKESSDPLAAIPAHIRLPGRTSATRTSSSRTPSSTDDASSARLARESSERARAQALIARKKAERARSDGTSTIATPSTVHGGYGDMYNRADVEEARRERTWGRRGKEVDMKGRRWDDEGRRR